MSAEIKELVDLINIIDNHGSLKYYLQKVENYSGCQFLYIDYLNDEKNKNEELEQLIEKLDTLACGLLITNKGQHSNAFYEIRNHGLYSVTGEKDSFGPLSSLIGPGNKNWVYVYG